MPRICRVGALRVNGRRLSVCLSVCPVPVSKSRMEGHTKLKIGRKEAHDADDPWPHFKFKVTGPINAETEKQPYLRKRKAYERRTWYTDGVRWPASPTCAVTSKVTTSRRQFDACLPITRKRKVAESPKLAGTVVHATADIPHQFQGQKVKGQGHQAALGGCRKRGNIVPATLEAGQLVRIIFLHLWFTCDMERFLNVDWSSHWLLITLIWLHDADHWRKFKISWWSLNLDDN